MKGQRGHSLAVFLFLMSLLIGGLTHPTEAYADTPHCGIIGNETWAAGGNIHVVTCDVTVPANVTLTIAAGAIIKLQNDADIIVNGKLVAQGTPGNPIYFTSYRDDSIGGDTDGAPTAGAVGDWGRILFNSGSDDTSIITRAVIRYSGDSNGSINEGSITLSNASPNLSYITFENNYINGVHIPAGTWQTDTWDNTTVIYVIEGGKISIPAANTLTIVPGMKIKMTASGNYYNVSFVVDGKLMAVGTKDNPIYFSSYLDDTLCGIGAFDEVICDSHNDGPSAGIIGNWGTIQFNSGSDDTSTISRVIMRYSGRVSLSISQGPIILSNASPNLSYITFENNYINGVDLAAGAWQTDTWDNTTVIYVIEDGSVTIPAANTLTIAPNMKVKLNGTSLAVDGKFVASGTSANPVFFSSKKDDSLCGVGAGDEAICDTNNNGSSAGAARDWGNIQFNSGSDDTSTITQAIVRYGSAVRLTAASPTISSTQLVNNYRGIEALTDSTPILVCNDIHSNTNLGIYNDPPTTVAVTAKGHWWGNASGPTHAGNPGGTGQSVSDGVDYAPWLSAPCDSPPPLTYQIKGRVTEADGSPLAGVTISAGAGLSAVTDSAGNYTLAGLAANTYALTASKSGRNFLPASQVVTVPPDKTGVNFTAQPQVDLAVTSIDLPASPVCAGSSPSFQANFRNNGATASGVFDIHWVADSQTFGSTQAGVGAEAGTFYRYVWQNVSAGQHRLTFVVDPLNQISESNESNNQQTITFTAQDCTRYTITGRVTNEVGGGVSSVTISAGAGLTAVTDSNGNYTLTNLPAGGYTLTASKSGYSFTPVSRSFTLPPSATGQDFVVNVIQPPSNVQATDGAFTDKVRVTWSASTGATYYQVYRATTPTGPKSLIGSPANLLLDDTTTAKYVTYYYFIKACNSIICSNFSSYDPGWRDGVVEGPPVDVYMIVDLSASFSDELPLFKAQASAIIAALRASNPNTRFGLGRFEDYPISPFGVASTGDKAYQRVVDLTFNAPSILSAISSLSVRHGGDDPESQLAALYQAASGTGQNLAGVGYPGASIPAGQQANFRREATKLILLWTDAPFHRPGEAGAIPYPGPSFSQTVNAIRALGNIKVLGMVSAVRSSSLAAADTVQTQAIEPASTTSDLQEIVKGTGGVALAGVDCNGDGTPDISPGQPLVCTFTSADIEIGKAVVALVEAGRTQTKTFLPLLVK